MPARSVSWAISGENGALSSRRDRQRVGDLDLVDLRKLRLAQRALRRHVAVERELHGFGVERFAVLEFHVRPQLDGDGLPVFRRLMRERELRHDVEIAVDVEQLVAQRGEHDAADVRTRRGWIEIVGIFRETDAQVALRERGCRRDGCGEQRCDESGASLQGRPPRLCGRREAYRWRGAANSVKGDFSAACLTPCPAPQPQRLFRLRSRCGRVCHSGSGVTA